MIRNQWVHPAAAGAYLESVRGPGNLRPASSEAFQEGGPDHLSGSLLGAQPPTVCGQHHRGASCHPWHRHGGRAARAGGGTAAGGGIASRPGGTISSRISRRAALADRHRPGPGPQSTPDLSRRTGFCLGRFHPGPSHQPSGGAQGPVRPDLHFHFP